MARVKVLITGGSGYIAQSIIKALHAKYDITTITKDDFDLTNYASVCKFLEGKYFDVVIHTAIVGGNRLQAEDSSMLEANLLMYYNLISNKEHFGKFISFGSGAELGMPTTPYGFSKRIIAESMSKLDYCLNIRIFAVFDENELDRRFIKSNVLKYINNEAMTVHQNKVMDFFYMKDLITLIDYHLKHRDWLFNTIDCTYDRSYTLLEIAQMINKLDSHKVPIHVDILEGNPYSGNYVGLLIPLVGLKEGIREVYESLKQKI